MVCNRIFKLKAVTLADPLNNGLLLMAAKPKKSAATETRQSIAEQTAAFLKSGGQIQEIAQGVTGQEKIAGPRQIVLGKPSGR